MPTAPVAMPRGADQRFLRFSTARAQARADESALRLKGGDDVAHAHNINNNSAMAESSTALEEIRATL